MNSLLHRDGISQDERLLDALREGYINVDELRFEDFLSIAADYSELLKYTDTSNLHAGNWRGVFDADEVSILASIAVNNINWFARDATALVREADEKLGQLRDNKDRVDALPTFKLAKKIDYWLLGLEKLPSESATRAHEKVLNVVEKILKLELHKLHYYLSQNGVDSKTAIQQLSTVWQKCDTDFSTEEYKKIFINERQFYKSNCYTFYNTVLFMQNSVGDLLIQSLNRHDHDPGIGLFITFLKLFKNVQDKINEFTPKHLSFYYEDVLKIQRREFVSDRTYLLFAADKAGREVLIKRDTEFNAGLDEHNVELLYAANNDLRVNDAKVCALHTLYFDRNELSSPENALLVPPCGDLERYFVTSAQLNRIHIQDGNDLAEKQSQPLFGVPGRSKLRGLFEDARLGIAVASNILLLKQGQRKITLTFKLAAHDPLKNLDSFIHTLNDVLSETTLKDAFYKAFRNMFKICFSSETGWLQVDEYLPLCHLVDAEGCEKDCFKLILQLDDSAPAIVPYLAEIHGENFSSDSPIVKLLLNHDAYLYPYSLLSELVVNEISIEVDVKGCTDVQVYNQSGPLSSNAQFTPFGSLPSLGDYLLLGNYEAARKKLSNFEVNIEWGNLPQGLNGFEDSYREYDMPFENASFQISHSALRDRKWMPVDTEQLKVNMFESGDDSLDYENNKVVKNRCYSLQGVCKHMQPLENISEDQYGYNAITKDGFFKMTLANPEFAFGHKDYPLILSKVMTDNALLQKYGLSKLFSKTLPSKPLPNPPYTPVINSISINYCANTTISLEWVGSHEAGQLKERVFHLHPLGIEKLSSHVYGKVSVIPHYEADGNLFIGLSASKISGLLTLFFHLRDDSLPEASTRDFDFSWHYLASNEWKQFTPAQVISDSSHDFLTSGIVTLDIPEDISKGNSILPEDLFWIRVSVNSEHIHTLCSLYGVHTQAVEVTWKKQTGNSLAHLTSPLPAKTIKTPKFSLPGISLVAQIMDSSGGRPPESATQQTVRVSERLRHKSRAITRRDYESLILQRFPDIFKVKCFPCMTDDITQDYQAKPGHVLIVVIPYLKDTASINFRPMVNALLLKEIKEYVEKIASPAIKIRLRNPAYEQIQVRCRVKFKSGVAQGWAFNELNQAIVDFLSPWDGSGINAKFDWSIRCYDIQAHLQKLDYIESISGFSLLKIVEDDARQHHQLSDTKRSNTSEVTPSFPWSIAIPTKSHLIEVEGEKGTWEAQLTGVSNLSIGSTFILSRSQ